MNIGLAVTTNKFSDVALRFLPHSIKKEISECSIVYHCNQESMLSISEKEDAVSKLATEYTKVFIENSSHLFHEARAKSFELLHTDIKVKWDDDHAFSQHEGGKIFKERCLNAVSQFGGGIYYFQIPTFSIHPRLLSRTRPVCGLNGDVFFYTQKDASVNFTEDVNYADRQLHSAKAKASIGFCGAVHLDHIKPMKYLAYRGQLNSKLRNFNIKHASIEDAWQCTFSESIERRIRQLVYEMNKNPNAYFVKAPESWVEQLPTFLYERRNTTLNEFRNELFNEALGLTFSTEDVTMLDTESLNISQKWIHKGF